MLIFFFFDDSSSGMRWMWNSTFTLPSINGPGGIGAKLFSLFLMVPIFKKILDEPPEIIQLFYNNNYYPKYFLSSGKRSYFLFVTVIRVSGAGSLLSKKPQNAKK